MTVRPFRRRATMLLASLVAVGSLAACSSTPEDPKEALAEAQASMNKQDEVSMVIDLDATPEEFAALAQGSSEAESTRVGNLLSETTITLNAEAQGDKPLGEETDASKVNMTLVADIGGEGPVTVTLFEGDLFMRVDMKGIAEVTGMMDEDQVRQLGREAGQEWQKALFKGRWLTMDQQSMKALGDQIGSLSGAGGVAPSASPDEMLKTQANLVEALNKHSTAAYAEAKDDDEFGKAIDLTIKAKPFMDEMSKAQGGDADTSGIAKDATITATAWVKRGSLTKVEVPLDQMRTLADTSALGAAGQGMGEKGLPGNLVVTFDDRAQIEKAFDPTPVTAEDLMSLGG